MALGSNCWEFDCQQMRVEEDSESEVVDSLAFQTLALEVHNALVLDLGHAVAKDEDTKSQPSLGSTSVVSLLPYLPPASISQIA